MHQSPDIALRLAEQRLSELRQLAAESRLVRASRDRFFDRIRRPEAA